MAGGARVDLELSYPELFDLPSRWFALWFFEYWGEDFTADMDRMKADPMMRRWWDLMEPMQEPLPTRAEGEWWARMEEVFRHE